MGKSLGTLLHFWGVFQFTQAQSLPSPHKQSWKRVSGIFFRVSTLYRVWGARTARKSRKGCTVLWGNPEMTDFVLSMIVIRIQPRWLRLASATQVHELTAELEQLPRRAQVAAGFITYLSSAPEDVRKATMAKWCEAAGLQGFDFRRFMSTESEQLGWKTEGLPSDDLSMENALVILKVTWSVCSFNVQLSVFCWKFHLRYGKLLLKNPCTETAHKKRTLY